MMIQRDVVPGGSIDVIVLLLNFAVAPSELGLGEGARPHGFTVGYPLSPLHGGCLMPTGLLHLDLSCALP